MKLKGQPTGALVGEVEPNAPAAKAGIKTGDVITAVNGKKVNDPRELRLMIGSMAPATKAHIDVNREGQTKTFDVQLAEMPATAAGEAKAGLREGDVIQEVNKQPVKSARDLVAISKKLKPNEKILIRVYSQGRSGYVALGGG
jgi:S1-C subfamily serine protease